MIRLKYTWGNGLDGAIIVIKKDMGNGWYFVETDDKSKSFYFNMAHATYLKEME